MKTFIAYKQELTGISDVSQMVKITEKIAASSIHRLKEDVRNLETYITHIETAINRGVGVRAVRHPLCRSHGGNGTALVVLSGDVGIVGNLWHDVVNLVLACRNQYETVISFGLRGTRYLEEEGISLQHSFRAEPESEDEEARLTEALQELFDDFRAGRVARVDIAYPKFVTLAHQEPHIVPFLPFAFTQQSVSLKESPAFPIYDPSRRVVADRLLEQYAELSVRRLIFETRLSELSARMVASEHAGEKTEELTRRLWHAYRKDRRRMITARQQESFYAFQSV